MFQKPIKSMFILNLVKDSIKKASRQYSTERVVKFEYQKDMLQIHVAKDTSNVIDTLKFNPLWLRFNCHAAKSRVSDSNQRIIDAEKIPMNLTIKECKVDDQNVYIDWNQDDTKTMIPIKYLLNNHPVNKSKINSNIKKVDNKMESFDYSKFFVNNKKNEEEINRWLRYFLKYGVCLLKNVSTKDGMVLEIGKLIGPIHSTLYGDMFDVLATPKPINLAYSDSFLCLHSDLMYYESPPGIQLLHCIRNDDCVKGGESIVLDALVVAQQFREKYPEHFDILTKVPVTFQKILVDKAKPLYMVHKKPHIVLNHRNKIIAVNWAPQNEGPIVDLTEDEVDKYYQAYILFTKFLNNHPEKIELLLKPGDVMVFNNRRMLHSRNAFQLNGGLRHLQGCYVNMDIFKSDVLLNVYKNSKSDDELIENQNTVMGNYDYNEGL